ncbi:hypothetical protein C8Q73DRAFT_532419 [Cubamyces lactineus]|nr:hypothetical protein C8Q73DRAFT_532419 [Cubamyces lactineus]
MRWVLDTSSTVRHTAPQIRASPFPMRHPPSLPYFGPSMLHIFALSTQIRPRSQLSAALVSISYTCCLPCGRRHGHWSVLYHYPLVSVPQTGLLGSLVVQKGIRTRCTAVVRCFRRLRLCGVVLVLYMLPNTQLTPTHSFALWLGSL